jgi:hypothetical protein
MAQAAVPAEYAGTLLASVFPGLEGDVSEGSDA